MPLLEIRNLSVDFLTASGPFRAVDGVDIDVDAGEILAIVGESGSGKSVSMLAMMGLLPWTATISADALKFDGQDLRSLSPRARRRIIGKDMAMIFQEPMSSLNPCFTAGYQIKEALRLHLGLDAAAHLENNDAYPFFRALGDLLVTGPTGTNVADLAIGWARKE
jgi:dipeptide transport system ATP-binding protein